MSRGVPSPRTIGSSCGQIASAWAARLRTIDSSAVCFACAWRSAIARIAYSSSMVAARCALCAVVLGGCLIVRATDDPVEEPCPAVAPDVLADAHGPFVITDAIYFVGANGTLSKVG